MSLSVTVAELRQYLDQIPSDQADEERLTQFLAEAESQVELALLPLAFGAYGAAAARDVQGEARASVWLKLPPHQTSSVTSVALIAGKGTTGESTTAITDYDAGDRNHLWRGLGWGADLWYRVTAVWGCGPAPRALRGVAYRLTVNAWRSRDRGGFSELLGAADGGMARFVAGLPKQDQDVIRNVVRFWKEPVV